MYENKIQRLKAYYLEEIKELSEKLLVIINNNLPYYYFCFLIHNTISEC